MLVRTNMAPWALKLSRLRNSLGEYNTFVTEYARTATTGNESTPIAAARAELVELVS